MSIVLTVGVWTLVGIGLGLLALLGLCWWLGLRRGRREAARLGPALDRLPLGVALFGRGGEQRYANPPAAALLPLLDGAVLNQARRAARGDAQQTSIVRGREDLAVQLYASALPDGDLLVALRDIGDDQQAERGYRQLIHTLSHEALTPLTAVQGHLAHIAAVARPTPEWAGSLEVVRGEIDRLTRLTSNLLILSRLEAGQPLQRRPTNLAALAEETVLQLLERADARGITLTLNAPPQLPRPALDRDAFKQVLLNLVDNGVKYGREGGTVTITLHAGGGSLGIDVDDDGPGIPLDDQPHLFTPLFRGENQRLAGGNGLGLAIVRKIVEGHGGSISCVSRPGAGASFKIRLPLEVTRA